MTDTQIKKIFKESTYIIVDSREKRNEHIIKAFDKFGVKYKSAKMNYGDYGIEIEKNEALGIKETIRFSVSVERKRNLQEIGSNLTKGRVRFLKEMQRCVDDDGLMVIMIENASYLDVIMKNYKNKLTPKQFMALLHDIWTDYKVPFVFMSDTEAPLFIYNFLKYYAKEYLNYLKLN